MVSTKEKLSFLIVVLFVILSSLVFYKFSLGETNEINLDSIEFGKDSEIEVTTFVSKGKLHPEVKTAIDENPTEKITVILEAEKVELFDLDIKSRVNKFVTIEIEANKLEDLIEEEEIINVWPDRKYSALLSTSIPLIEPQPMWDLGYDGEGIKIAILDTGIDSTHPMLQGRIIAESDFSRAGHVNDLHGHGTHVAGIAAGKKVDEGYDGVAPGALLINAKVLDDTGDGSTTTIINGIYWAVEQGADIISMSLGGPYKDPDGPINQAIFDAVNSGVVVVVSAGNCGSVCPSDDCNGYVGITTPGDSRDAITVGATDENKDWACYSSGDYIENVGIKPDISAPGSAITSSIPGSYGLKSGTSMAAPHVAGAVALLLQQHPDYTPLQVKKVLEHTAEDLGEIGKDIKYGFGFLNIANFVDFDISYNYDVVFQDTIYRNEILSLSLQFQGIDEITSVNITITKPDNIELQFDLVKQENNFVIDFDGTDILGLYNFEIVITDIYGFSFEHQGSFEVIGRDPLEISTFAGNVSEVTLNITAGGEETVYIRVPKKINVLNASTLLSILTDSLSKVSICGDGVCGEGEDYNSCSDDCDPAPILLPDLLITDLYYSGPSYIYVTYCNIGDSQSQSDFLIKIRNEKTGIEFPGNANYRFSVPLPGSCSQTGGLTCSLIGLSCGEDAQVSVIIDWESRVNESDESNNILTKWIGDPPICGDGICDEGEDDTNCPGDCNRLEGESCISNSDCSSGYCVGDVCGTSQDYCETDSDCVKKGCSGTICQSTNAPTVYTTCDWREEYACYQQTTCGCTNGGCGFESPQIENCLAQYQ